MKTHIFPAIKLTLVTLVFFSGIYTMAVWVFARFVAPNNGKGQTVSYITSKDNVSYGFVLIGQSFTADKYFWSRPSAVNYAANGSGGSNKGPSNPDLLNTIEQRIDTFMVHNPGVKRADIPVEMVTASGSGLDPHISPMAAIIQIPRIAKIRHISEDDVTRLVNQYTEQPLLGLFGTPVINVLKLNIALDMQTKGVAHNTNS